MEKGRISAITERINVGRDPNIEVGKEEQIKETGEFIGYISKFGDMQTMYEHIKEDTKEIKRQKRDNVDRQVRDARSDSADLGIGEIY